MYFYNFLPTQLISYYLQRLRFLTTPEDRPAYGDQQITLNAIGEYVPKKTSKTNKLYGNPQ